jgi:AGCS family alanine or glycine:cation symporter
MKDKKAQKKLGFDPVFIPSRCGMKGAEIREGIAAKIIPEPPTVLEKDNKALGIPPRALLIVVTV